MRHRTTLYETHKTESCQRVTAAWHDGLEVDESVDGKKTGQDTWPRSAFRTASRFDATSSGCCVAFHIPLICTSRPNSEPDISASSAAPQSALSPDSTGRPTISRLHSPRGFSPFGNADIRSASGAGPAPFTIGVAEIFIPECQFIGAMSALRARLLPSGFRGMGKLLSLIQNHFFLRTIHRTSPYPLLV